MSTSASPSAATSASRAAIRSRLASREPVPATWPETSTSRASNMRAIVSAGADIVCGHGSAHRLAVPGLAPGLAVPGRGEPRPAAPRVRRPDVPPRPRRRHLARHPHPGGHRDALHPRRRGGRQRDRRGLGRRAPTGRWSSCRGCSAPTTTRRASCRPPPLAQAWRRHQHWRVGATDLVMESLVPAIIEQKVTGMEALGRLPGDGAPVRRAGAGAAERAGAGRAALGAAVARGAARHPVVGVAQAAGRRSPVTPDPARGAGGDLARAGRPGDPGGVRPPAAHAARHRGLDERGDALPGAGRRRRGELRRLPRRRQRGLRADRGAGGRRRAWPSSSSRTPATATGSSAWWSWPGLSRPRRGPRMAPRTHLPG